MREVHEETGYRVQPGRSLGEVRYLKKSGGAAREKVVHYWAMRAISGGFSPNREVDRLKWLTVDEARERVTRGIDREVLERFALRPVMTGSVLLVRHASAGSRGELERGRQAAAARRDGAGPGRRAGAAAVPVRGR